MSNKITLILLALPVIFFISSCKKTLPKQEERTSLPVRTEIVLEQQVAFPIHTSGRLSSKIESKLSFKTGGIIQKIYVDEGQTVQKGYLLAALDLSEIKSKDKQAELAQQKAQRDYERVKNLYEDSVVTLEQFQDSRTALEVARTNASIAKFNLEYSEIRAPSNGKILKRVAEASEIVGPGQPVFLFASIETAWVIRVNLTDRDIVRIRLGDSSCVSFDAYPGRTFNCRVSEIGNSADPYTGTYEVELHLDDQPETLVSGIIAKVDIFLGKSTRKMIVIPVEALTDGNGLTGNVYIVRDERPVKRTIEIYEILATGIVVSSGLQDGDEIITEGGEYIRDSIAIERIK